MKNERISRDTMLMNIARIVALRGTCNRAKVGAVFAKDNRIVVTGYVGSDPGSPHCIDEGCIIGPAGGCIRTNHAEKAAIRFADDRNISLKGTTLYVTLSPCESCATLIWYFGIVKVIYYKEYRKREGIEFLKSKGVEVVKYSRLKLARSWRLI